MLYNEGLPAFFGDDPGWPSLNFSRLFHRTGFRSVRGNPDFERLCSARLQAGTLDASACSPEGKRYRPWPKVVARALPAMKKWRTKAKFHRLETCATSHLDRRDVRDGAAEVR